jgi:hypothetical protein
MACISRHWPGKHGVSFHDPRGDAGHERGETNMQDDNRLPCLLASCLVVLPIITACAIRYVPRELAMVIITWMMVSISVGVSFGHCVLNDP